MWTIGKGTNYPTKIRTILPSKRRLWYHILAWPTNLVLLTHLADIVAYIELKQTLQLTANFMITFV